MTSPAGHAARFYAAIARYPVATRAMLALYITDAGVEVHQRGELAAWFRTHDLGVLADAIARPRVPRGGVVCFVDVDEAEEPFVVVVDVRGNMRDVPLREGR